MCSIADVVRSNYHGEQSTTTVEPYELAGHRGAMLAISLQVPQCRHEYISYDPDEGTGQLWFLDSWSGSWASHFHSLRIPAISSSACASKDPGDCGMRSTWWTEQGRPDEHDWVFTVHPDRQTITLPTQPH